MAKKNKNWFYELPTAKQIEYCRKLKGRRASRYCNLNSTPRIKGQANQDVYSHELEPALIKSEVSKLEVSPKTDTYYEVESSHEWAKQSEVKNLGEDLKGAARHKRNQYRDWEAFEDFVKSDDRALNKSVLMKNFSPDFELLILGKNTDPEKVLFLERCLAKFPAKCPESVLSSRTDMRQHYALAFKTLTLRIEELIKDNGISVDQAQIEMGTLIKSIREKNSKDGEYNTFIILNSDLRRMAEKIRKNYSSTSAKQDLIQAQREAAVELSVITDEELRISQRQGAISQDLKAKLMALSGPYREALKIRLGKSSLKRKVGLKTKGFKEQDWYKDFTTYEITGNDRGISTLEQAENFMIKEAKFKGIQFGNAMADNERSMHLIAAAKSLKDLAQVTGLSLKTITMDGELGLAFGARGSGKAMATYQPCEKVINLTRKSGFGSLAHELGHALDNKLGLKQDGQYASEIFYGEATRESAAMRGLHSSMEKMRLRILQLDQYGTLQPKTKQYMISKREVFARCFESYVHEKLKKKNIANTYLVHKPENLFYPTPSEASEMELLFDNLVAAVENKSPPSVEASTLRQMNRNEIP